MTLGTRTGFLVAALVIALPSLAHADCANPTGVKGEFFYNDDFSIMQFCDGTDWIAMGGGSGAGVTDGDKGDISVSGSGANWMIDDDALDFTEFKDALSLDASTDIAISGSQVFSLTNTGTGDSFVVNDQASDTTPFVIDTAGNVGIGIAVPTQALDVVGKTTSNSFIVKPQTGLAAPTGGAGGSGNWSTDGTHVWRATGNVGIGTASPADLLEIAGSVLINTDNARLRLQRLGTNYIDFNDANMLAFRSISPTDTNATIRMSITAAGNVGIGTASPGQMLEIKSASSQTIVQLDSANSSNAGIDMYENGTRRWIVYSQGSNDAFYIMNGSSTGVSLASGATSWGTTSDARLKTNIQELSILDRLPRYRAVSFDWRGNGQHDIGVVAQEIYALFPEVVHKGSESGEVTGLTDPNAWNVMYDKLGALALQAVKELKAANDNQAAEIKALRAEIEALKAAR